MIGEINKIFYCSAVSFDNGVCKSENGSDISLGMKCRYDKCPNYRSKHPTPEQFKKEYGYEYPNNYAVYLLIPVQNKWHITSYKNAKILTGRIFCACTPWGCPDKDWSTE